MTARADEDTPPAALERVSEAPLRLGRYLISERFAAGGMATVHIGKLLGVSGFSRLVAVKRALPTWASHPDFAEMLMDEARISSRVRHANVVQVVDVIREGRELGLVMEYIHGEPLSKLLAALRRQKKRVPIPIALAITVDVLRGLHAAHEANDEGGQALHIIHRDVSPQNVIVGTDGLARLIDFGIAKAFRRVHQTTNGRVKGKMAYMAPEQMTGAALTLRVDVYAAGVVLWEMLAGRRLFSETDEVRVIARVLQGDVPTVRTYDPDLPPAIEDIVMRALAAEPTNRFESAAAMAAELCKFGSRASTEEVGIWVESVAGANLRARAELVAKLERVSALSASESRIRAAAVAAAGPMAAGEPVAREAGVGEAGAAQHAAARAVAAASEPSIAERAAPTPASRAMAVNLVKAATLHARPLVASLCLALVCVVGGLMVARTPVKVKSEIIEPNAKFSPPVVAPEPKAVDVPDGPMIGIADAPPDEAEPLVAAPPETLRSQAPKRNATPAAAPDGKKSARRSACDPPYWIDSRGHRHSVAACL